MAFRKQELVLPRGMVRDIYEHGARFVVAVALESGVRFGSPHGELDKPHGSKLAANNQEIRDRTQERHVRSSWGKKFAALLYACWHIRRKARTLY